MDFFRKLRQFYDGGKKAWYSVDGFEAATFTRDRAFIQTPGTDAMVNPSEFSRFEITRMSRYLINNYPLAERIASLCEIYGVGGGISANATTADSEFNKSATDAFGNWAGNVFCTADNEMSFYEAQKVIVRELLVCGEVFLVLIKSPGGYPQVTLVNSENVRTSGTDGDTSTDGIYFSDYGKALAYNIFSGKSFQRVAAQNVIHLKRVKNIGQKRGIGMFASSLNSMRDHKDMSNLIKKSLKTQLTMAVVVTKKALDAEDGIASGIIPAINNGPTTQPTGKGIEQVYGASVKYLNICEDVKMVASENPSANVQEFLELIMRDVCLSVSLPYEFVVNPDKLNGTAVRFSISDAAAFFGSLQTLVIDGALNRIYSWVIASFINSKKLPAPADNALPWEVSFTLPCSITVDKGRSDISAIALLQIGLLTYEAYYSARGLDWQKEVSQSIAEKRFITEQAKANGIPLELLLPALAGTQPTPEEQEKQPEQKPEDKAQSAR